MKTKIIMMTALVALLATGCGKEQKNGRIRIFAENMTNAVNSKLMIDPASPANSAQWLEGESIDINGERFLIEDDGNGGYQVDINNNDFGGALVYYALYPGDDYEGNSFDIHNDDPFDNPSITINNLELKFHSDGTHDVVFPMGAMAEEGTDDVLIFKHLTAGFRMTLNATSSVTVKKLKVIVYGTPQAGPVDDAVSGISYAVAWKDDGMLPLPGGGTGSVTDRDVAYASVMNFDLKTEDVAGVTFTGTKQLCIPVTLASVNRITVIGYNGDTEVFNKTAAIPTVDLVRNKIYPVGPISVN